MACFEERIKELRTGKNLSQDGLGKALDKSRETIANWESGKTRPDFETLDKISSFFGVSSDYVIGRTDEKYGAAGDGEKYLADQCAKIFKENIVNAYTDTERKILDQFRKLTPDRQQFISMFMGDLVTASQAENETCAAG
jgi:transcriptional regulator with XRE-family HTH domain